MSYIDYIIYYIYKYNILYFFILYSNDEQIVQQKLVARGNTEKNAKFVKAC